MVLSCYITNCLGADVYKHYPMPFSGRSMGSNEVIIRGVRAPIAIV